MRLQIASNLALQDEVFKIVLFEDGVDVHFYKLKDGRPYWNQALQKPAVDVALVEFEDKPSWWDPVMEHLKMCELAKS